MPFASAVTYFQEHDLDLNNYLQPPPVVYLFLRMEGTLSAAPVFTAATSWSLIAHAPLSAAT